jgi:Tol biopolymer transport system component
MRHARWIVPAGILLSVCAFVMGGTGPDDRTITDPASVVSAPNPEAHAIPIEDLFFTRSVATGAWSPDGKQVLLTTDISGRDNLWKVPAGGGWPIQLTQSEDRQLGVWSPDGKTVLFQQDFGGNEVWDILAVPSDGGPVINLTNTPDIREQDPRWSPDGTTIAIGYKPKSGTVYDIALLDWSTHKVTKLTHEQTTNHSWGSVAWSRDGATLYATRTDASFTDADVYAINVRTGEMTDLTTHEGRSLNIASSLSPDGTRLLLTSDQKGGYNNVALLDIATKQLTWATNDKWESTAGDFSPDGSRFTYVVNADGRADAYLRGPKEDRHYRRLIRRVHDADGCGPHSGYLGSGRRGVRHHRLAHHAPTFRSGVAAVREDLTRRARRRSAGLRDHIANHLPTPRAGTAPRPAG